VIVASNIKKAAEILQGHLSGCGLPQKISESDLKEVDITKSNCIIINNGNY